MSCAPRSTAPAPWRLRSDAPLIGFDNMAVDEQSLEGQKDAAAVPVVRFFRWASPTLSFGRLQDHHDAANKAMLNGCRSIIRRPTGGGMVPHKRKDLSLSVAWRRDHRSFPACIRDVYRALHEAVRGSLEAAGIKTDLHAGPSAVGAFCFETPASDDLMKDGVKVLGGALRVTSWGRLYQGDLLIGKLDLSDEAAEKILTEAFAAFFSSAPERIPSAPPAT